MSYINRLQKVCEDQAAASRETQEAINNLRRYLQSPKFYQDTTVQVSDVDLSRCQHKVIKVRLSEGGFMELIQTRQEDGSFRPLRLSYVTTEDEHILINL